MKLKIESENITPLFDTYGNFIDEAIIKLDQKGLSSVASDRAMVCIFGVQIPKEKFDIYEVEKEEQFGVTLATFVDILKRAGKETIEISREGSQIVVKMGERTFFSPLALTGEDIPNYENLEFTSYFRIKSDVLLTAVADGKLSGDTVWFETDETSVRFSTLGDMNKNEVMLERGNQNLFEVKGKAKAQYPIDYLDKLKKVSDELVVHFSEQAPCKISFLGGFFILAPRVTEKEEGKGV